MWQYVLLLYLFIGFFLVRLTSARKVIHESLQEDPEITGPKWKVFLFFTVMHTVLILFWPLFISSWFRKTESVWDCLQKNEIFKSAKEITELNLTTAENAVDADELPNGYGEFGLVSSNPIPCNSIINAIDYLHRLRSEDGKKINFKRSGSTFSDVTHHPIDIYAISSVDGEILGNLYLTLYQKCVSKKIPKGFVLSR